jgi:3-phenylpropionate/trans-cinnamate dioxygenase ferredoxin component
MAATTKPYQFACKRSSLKNNVPITAEIQDRFVVVALIDEAVYCIEDLCTHDGGTLGDGEVDNGCIVCPRHGAKFDLKTGHAMCMPATEATLAHEVSIVGDDVMVRLRDH